MKRKYRVVLWEEKEGGYSIKVPLVKGCFSQGDAREEALINIKESLELMIEGMKEKGLQIPIETEVEVDI